MRRHYLTSSLIYALYYGTSLFNFFFNLCLILWDVIIW